MLRVAAVEPGSLGAELGLAPGDELLSINGRELIDFLDWEFLAADETFLLNVRTAAGEAIEFDIERPEDLPLGISLDPPKIRRCANRCDFCFVDGNPEGSRKTLFIRDDDYRLSFRHGNFATLSNLKDKDIKRILEYRLSPLYGSVHATDAEIRRRLLRNPKAPAILEQLGMFAAGGIQFHAQIVLVPGVNDGAVLEQSLKDLYDMKDAILTVSIVPVALTAFSRRDVVTTPTRAEARAAVQTRERWAATARAERGEAWVYGSDELYMLAELPFPTAADYDGYPQVENGVGSVRYLEELIATETQLAQMQKVSPNNPQVSSLRSRTESLRSAISVETSKVTGGGASLTSKSAAFERFSLDRAFAEKQLASAMTSLELARSEAQRKQLYLERLVQPNLPDKAVEPRRIRSIFMVLVLGLILWGVISLLVASVREHVD